MIAGEDRITVLRDSAQTQTQTWTLSETRTFVYDLPAVPAPGTQSQALQVGQWNCIFERRVDAAQTVTDAAYVWGLDLPGTLQGAHSTGSGPSAGGVGSLLQASQNVGGGVPTAIFYVYDGSRPRTSGGDGLSKGAQRATEGSSESEGRTATSGNVTALVDAGDGSVVARYDYSPFGMTVLIDVPAAVANPWRFSTKYHDTETALVYYGYRYYSPELGRWINRDPIGERGGVPLHVLLSTRPSCTWDVLGSADADTPTPREIYESDPKAYVLANVSTRFYAAAVDMTLRFGAPFFNAPDYGIHKDWSSTTGPLNIPLADLEGLPIRKTTVVMNLQVLPDNAEVVETARIYGRATLLPTGRAAANAVGFGSYLRVDRGLGYALPVSEFWRTVDNSAMAAQCIDLYTEHEKQGAHGVDSFETLYSVEVKLCDILKGERLRGTRFSVWAIYPDTKVGDYEIKITGP